MSPSDFNNPPKQWYKEDYSRKKTLEYGAEPDTISDSDGNDIHHL